VRALLLDKSEESNWRLGWHQDRTIAVEQRIDVDGFSHWSVKAGQQHVQPPHDVTAAMITLRIHVDDIDADNAPLEILPGSHLMGRLSNEAVEHLGESIEARECLAEGGDIWAYSTAIVHRSAEQRRTGRRRVLQVDFRASELPGGLKWTELI
jgi:ectoine hydroxylase-related dioxygenase (phytanoyl-CoA dioxygenase family)